MADDAHRPTRSGEMARGDAVQKLPSVRLSLNLDRCHLEPAAAAAVSWPPVIYSIM